MKKTTLVFTVIITSLAGHTSLTFSMAAKFNTFSTYLTRGLFFAPSVCKVLISPFFDRLLLEDNNTETTKYGKEVLSTSFSPQNLEAIKIKKWKNSKIGLDGPYSNVFDSIIVPEHIEKSRQNEKRCSNAEMLTTKDIIKGGFGEVLNDYTYPVSQFSILHEGMHLKNHDCYKTLVAYPAAALAVQGFCSSAAALSNKIIQKPLPFIRGCAKLVALPVKVILLAGLYGFYSRKVEEEADNGAIVALVNDKNKSRAEKQKILEKTAAWFEFLDRYILSKSEEDIGREKTKNNAEIVSFFADSTHPRALKRAQKLREAIKNL